MTKQTEAVKLRAAEQMRRIDELIKLLTPPDAWTNRHRLSLHLRINHPQAGHVLQQAKNRGLVDTTTKGCKSRWYLTERLTEELCKRERELEWHRTRRLHADARRRAAKIEREASAPKTTKEEVEDAEIEAWLEIRRSFVRAEDVRAVKLGPASVFEFASML